jgi:beta-lactamase regulating signal transducer with metallopeptidase domain
MGALVEIGLWNAAGSALLALLVAAASRLVRRPALAHTLWLLVLLKLVTPPLVPFALPWPADNVPAVPSAAEPLADADLPPAEMAEDVVDEVAPLPPAAGVPWQWWAGLGWLTGSVLWTVGAAWHVVRFGRVLRRARRAPGPLQEKARELARRLGLRRCPDVWLVPGTVSPMVWALGRRPCLLFPSGLLGRLDEAGRAALLAHELAHVYRRDHWVRLLELAATGLFWWHPVLWWARRELHEAEEQCCDAWAVWALGGDGRPYALALLQAVAFVSRARLPLPAGASGSIGQFSHLKRRLAMVMQGNTSRSLSWAGLGAVLALGLLLLPLFPALGQDRAPDPKPRPETADPARDVRDREVEALKEYIRALELRRATAKETPKAEDGVLEKQLREVEAVIAVRQLELRKLEATAADLRARLKGAKPVEEAAPDVRPPQRPRTGYSAPKLAPETDPRTGQILNRTAPMPPPKTAEGRMSDLEKKLDQLQKELDLLRRELKQKPDVPAGPGL